MKAALLFAALTSLSAVAFAVETPVPGNLPTENESTPSVTEQKEQSFLERQQEVKNERMNRMMEAYKATKYCASPVYARVDGAWVVANDGHCDKGGFKDEIEARNKKLTLTDRKSL